MKDFTNYQFRCSGISNLMVNPRSKKETLSETTKTFLKDVYIAEAWGREFDIFTKFTDKGNYAEEDSLTLITNVRKKLYIKNKDNLKNEWVTGTPDLILEDRVIDIKTCWDMRTFINKDGVEKNYYYQLQGYMWLTGTQKAELVFTLVNTPEHLIVSEKNKRMFQTGYSEGTPEWDAEEKRIDKWMTFDDIPEDLRIKTFEVERNDEEIEELKIRIADARDYLNSLTLN